MIATVEINHPKAKNYTKKQIEAILLDLISNYFEENDGIDGKLYPINYDELPKKSREKLDLLRQMTPEERQKVAVNI